MSSSTEAVLRTRHVRLQKQGDSNPLTSSAVCSVNGGGGGAEGPSLVHVTTRKLPEIFFADIPDG